MSDATPVTNHLPIVSGDSTSAAARQTLCSVPMSTPNWALQTSAAPGKLVDRFGRVHRSLRVSVIDACNIRCQYCMPATGVQFLPRERLLEFDHIERFVRTAVAMGINKVRLTGGEPLLRPELHDLVARLRAIDGLQQLALTTNGMLLANQIDSLVSAGLQRINISLDTLSEPTFRQLTRRDGLDRVLAGIEAARRFPQLELRLNALVLRDVNLDDVFDLVDFAQQRQCTLRFIEFMPLDSDRQWSQARMVSGNELRSLLAGRFGPLRRCSAVDPSQPSSDYEFIKGDGRVGFIDSVSQPFCAGCDRLRLTADGNLRNCLFGRDEWDVGKVLRMEPFDSCALQTILSTGTLAKRAAHGIDSPDFQPPERAMYQIGG
ncbi:MAG: GTP 3',8-cyclase MoaA [Aureliella sp.]